MNSGILVKGKIRKIFILLHFPCSTEGLGNSWGRGKIEGLQDKKNNTNGSFSRGQAAGGGGELCEGDFQSFNQALREIPFVIKTKC